MADRSIDSVGPLTPDTNGNTHLIVIIDNFSRWVELYPAKGADALSAASALMQHYGRFGLPKKLVSDRGKEYCNELIKEFHKLLGVTHQTSIAYSHQENSLVERANLEVRRYLRDICYDRRIPQGEWSANIPIMMRIQNSLVKESTGCSPAYMLYAGGVDLDRGLFKQEVIAEVTELVNTSWSDWIHERKKAQGCAIEQAQRMEKEHHEQHVATDSGLRTEFQVGSYVLKRYPESAFGSGKPSKQHMNYTGPYKVYAVHKGVYTLLDEKNNRFLEPCTVHLLAPYVYDKTRVNPLEVRLKDTEDIWLIEQIVGHTGKFTDKSTLKFEVKWIGFEKTSLEPWNGLCDNIILHNYLRTINQTKYIPKRFQ